MLLYGLTGGIGSGKSTVVDLFRKAGMPAVECDQLGHQLLSTGPVAEAVRERFSDCRLAAGGIDRKRLAEMVFTRPAERRWLESLLHPAIWQQVLEWSRSQVPARACLVEGAVLLESPVPQYRELAGLVVVTAPWPVRLRRVMGRDGCSEDAVRARQSCQLPEAMKLLAADLVIYNGGSLESTRRQVESAAEMLLGESGGRP